jgi:hypothetical protein
MYCIILFSSFFWVCLPDQPATSKKDANIAALGFGVKLASFAKETY